MTGLRGRGEGEWRSGWGLLSPIYNFCHALALRVYYSLKYVPSFGGRDPPHRAGTYNAGLCPSLIGYGQ